LNWTDFTLVSGTAFMALLAGRNIAVFAVVATPVLTYHTASILGERGWLTRVTTTVTPRMARLNLAIIAAVVLAAALKVLLVFEPMTLNQVINETLPVRAAAFVRENPPSGNLFNAYNWGGYLLYALPEYPVFVDGRTDLYGDAILREYLNAARGGDGWRETLERYEITWVMVETGSGLVARLRDEARWEIVYQDEQASVIVREPQ
jgi:hypothetical protein